MSELGHRAYRKLGAHPAEETDGGGYVFRVWAPHARSVSVIGDFNCWDRAIHPMRQEDPSGIWECVIPGVSQFASYKYSIEPPVGVPFDKADPVAFHAETRPYTASKTFDLDGYCWNDAKWMEARRKQGAPYQRAVSIYEMHLGSWKRHGEGPDSILFDYDTIGDELIPYLRKTGYTHVEFLPVMEHPLDDSWGYQCTGYFAPTSRHGDPKGLMRLIDRLHAARIGVLLDWVPAHFPKDAHGLIEFDGTCLYESEDFQMREHPDWGTRIFDLSKSEVRDFLISSAVFWLDCFHADGLRVDAVASMLYLDYGRENGAWKPNKLGGRENLEAVEFIRELSTAIFAAFPDVILAAEESTSWPMVTKPVHMGGLGFNFKWNMGWMNDMLHYTKLDPYIRQHHHKDLTFSLMYAFSENYVLPISHDEVVHGKLSLIGRMPGTYDEKFAGVRAFLTYMYTHPGKKLLFMGQEFGQFIEWNFRQGLDWLLLEYDRHRQLLDFVSALNRFYRKTRPLWQIEEDWSGYEWVCSDDNLGNTVIYIRRDKARREVLVAVNFSPVYRKGYRIGVPKKGAYREVFNTDAKEYGGEGRLNETVLTTEAAACHGREHSISADIPPLGAVLFVRTRPAPRRAGEER